MANLLPALAARLAKRGLLTENSSKPFPKPKVDIEIGISNVYYYLYVLMICFKILLKRRGSYCRRL